MDLVQQKFSDLLKDQGVRVNSNQLDQFEIYCQELITWNDKMNLTAIKEREQIYIKHFYDSISLSFFYSLQPVMTLADIGSGAGFPSIPLKIMFPHLRITIIDSLNKRIQFLNHLTTQLKLSNVECIHSRAEDAARQSQFRDQFDLVTARAVARLNVLNELCLPFVRTDRVFIAMKGINPKEELIEAEYSIKSLQAKLIHVHAFELPSDQSTRHLIMLKKMKKTPEKYPRKAGLPLKTPLIQQIK